MHKGKRKNRKGGRRKEGKYIPPSSAECLLTQLLQFHLAQEKSSNGGIGPTAALDQRVWGQDTS